MTVQYTQTNLGTNRYYIKCDNTTKSDKHKDSTKNIEKRIYVVSQILLTPLICFILINYKNKLSI